MKRSEINNYIEEAKGLLSEINFKLPPFADWTPEDWSKKGTEVSEIRDNGLGWDVTDYGQGKFLELGLLLFTIRNGNFSNKTLYPKGYAEKIMVVKENQITPFHFHWNKREDIINRGGGELVIELYLADSANGLSKDTFSVSLDGVRRELTPGDKVILLPGESICLEPYVYHTFYGKPGSGPVVVGEVSDVNDDVNDNCYLEAVGRFPVIEEDVVASHHLCNEYPKLK
jgi:D-lyxose ketol-isomerase